MYEYAYDGILYVYDELANWYYMLISFTYEYVLVYIVKVWLYTLLNAMLCPVGGWSWFLWGYLIE